MELQGERNCEPCLKDYLQYKHLKVVFKLLDMMTASDVSQGVAIQLTMHANSVSLTKAVHAHRVTEASHTNQQAGLMEIATRQVTLAHGASALAAVHMTPDKQR